MHFNSFYADNKIFVLSAFLEVIKFWITHIQLLQVQYSIDLNTSEMDNSALAFPTGTMDNRRNYNSNLIMRLQDLNFRVGRGGDTSYDSASGYLQSVIVVLVVLV